MGAGAIFLQITGHDFPLLDHFQNTEIMNIVGKKIQRGNKRQSICDKNYLLAKPYFIAWFNIIPLNGDVVISIFAPLFMTKSNCMANLM